MKGLQLKNVHQRPQATRPVGRTATHIPTRLRTTPRTHRIGSNAAWFSPITPSSKQPQSQATRVVSLDTPTEVQTSTAEESSQYVWTKNWWPLIPVNYLDPKRPKAMTLLGVQLAVWKDGEGQWRVFKDACPHRLAPLSEGRVESDGTLLCSYHAWRYNGEGKCTTIPQSITPEAEATARSSKRSCAVSFPVKEEVGLLWVWPDESDTRWIESAGTPAVVSNVVKEMYAENGSLMWYMRELPYGYEALVENVTDPAHVNVSHHGLNPILSRYQRQPIAMQKNTDPSQWTAYETPGERVFDVVYPSPLRPDRMAMTKFVAPAHVQLGGGKDGTWTHLVSLYCTPVAPGKSRVIHLDLFNIVAASGGNGWKAAVMKFVMGRLFTPVGTHRNMNRLFDGDNVFLNIQETTLRNKYKGNWKKGYYLPAPCDVGVAAALSWMDKVGHPFPIQTTGAQGPVDRRVLLDRYAGHTAHCPICQGEVKRLSTMMTVVKFVAAACFLGACAVLGNVGLTGLVKETAPFITKAGAWVAGLLAAAAWSATGWMAKLEAAKAEFFFTDYIHAEKD